jgi:hypothetical protein
MLLLGNGQHLLLRQTGEIDAVFQA